MNFVFFILILVLLILVHELGHFLVAKWLKIKVEEFAIGFPPRLFTIRKGETDYSFNLFLFGGYVRLMGENEPASGRITPEDGSLRSESGLDLRDPSSAHDSRSFAHAPGWKQATITVAGVGMNFLFAWLAFIVVFLAGIQVDASHARYPQHLSDPHVVIAGIAPNSPAAAVGLVPGDVVLSIQSGADTLPANFTGADFQEFTATHPDADISLLVRHGQENREVTLRPAIGIVPDRAAIGVELVYLATERLPVLFAAQEGSQSFFAATRATALGLGVFATNLIRGQGNFTDVAGPVGIAQLGAESVSEGFSTALLFAAIISINLAILNLLPIPGLDGGRMIFIIIERIKGSAISPNVAVRITIVGFALLATLMILVTYHDIIRLI